MGIEMCISKMRSSGLRALLYRRLLSVRVAQREVYNPHWSTDGTGDDTSRNCGCANVGLVANSPSSPFFGMLMGTGDLGHGTNKC